MNTDLFLGEMFLLLVIGIALLALCHRFGADVIGLIVAGIIVASLSSSGLTTLKIQPVAHLLAEAGVVLLLYSVGIEFSLARLMSLGRTILGGGILQVTTTMLAVGLLCIAYGWSPGRAMLLAFIVSMSSTVIGIRLLEQGGAIGTPQGRITLGVLLFQDLLVLPAGLLVPLLGTEQSGVTGTIGARIVLGAIVLIGIFGTGYVIADKLLDRVAIVRNRELLLLMPIAICAGAAWAALKAGFSPALGAFIAGLAISRSRCALEVLGSSSPFKIFFGVMFFISIGMQLDLKFVMSEWHTVLGFAVLLVAVKFITGMISVLCFGYTLRVACSVGGLLAQMGELSFVMAAAGFSVGALTASEYQLVTAVGVTTMLSTPAVAQFGKWLGEKTSHLTLPAFLQFWRATEGSNGGEAVTLRDHVIIAGHGVAGHLVVIELLDKSIPFIVAELNPVTLEKLRKEKIPCQFGDCTNPAMLRHLGIERAKILVLSVSDQSAELVTVRRAIELNPKLVIIVRTKYLANTPVLTAAGAITVVPEDVASGVVLAENVAKQLGIKPLDAEDIGKVTMAVMAALEEK
jgi:monovalent cation:H+ antiporter-2, CPA2 family